jgi:hypothetical protein
MYPITCDAKIISQTTSKVGDAYNLKTNILQNVVKCENKKHVANCCKIKNILQSKT